MRVGWRGRLADLALERGGVLALVILGVYLWLAPSYIADGDNAEFSTLSVTGGVAHPPGYPLYVLYLRAMSWLPGSSGAHTAALATALLGAAAALVLHAACRAWGARAGPASIAVAIVAGGPVVLRLHTAAEVFALNDLMVALVLWLAAAHGPLRGTRRAVLLALVAGLGLSNHHTCALLAPVGILGVIRGVREARAPAVRTIACALGALAVGLSPYVYLFVAPRSAASWGHADSFTQLLAHFTRADYGGIGAFSPVPGEIDRAANLGALVGTLGRGWLWLPAVIAIGTLGYRTARTGDGEPRWGWAMLATTFVMAGPLLIARFNVAPEASACSSATGFTCCRSCCSQFPPRSGSIICGAGWHGARRRGARAPDRSRGVRGDRVRCGRGPVAAAHPCDALTGGREGHREHVELTARARHRARHGRRPALWLAVRAAGPRDPTRR